MSGSLYETALPLWLLNLMLYLRLSTTCSNSSISSLRLVGLPSPILKHMLINDSDDVEIPGDLPESDERCRSIERGAKIVTVMPSTYSLVLQMPRGNLETIYPRALVLAKIRQNISNREYRKAFLTCRSQRVDMNILHDYLPDQFLSSVERIIHQLRTVEYIDLLLSSLK